MRIVGINCVNIIPSLAAAGEVAGATRTAAVGMEPFYAGRWLGSAALVRNTCPRGIRISRA